MSRAAAVTRSNAHEKRREGTRKAKRPDLRVVSDNDNYVTPPTKARRDLVKPLTKNQMLYDTSMEENIITFGIGPAGTGKTWFAAARAAEKYLAGREGGGGPKRLIITRPVIEVGRSLGALPGELDEKFEPYFRPVREALEEVFGSSHLEYLIKSKLVEARPLELLRGASLKNAIIIADEMQNSTPAQMKMLLTRIGEDTKLIINGDQKQQDIPGLSGLDDAINRLMTVDKIGIVEFSRDDIVRSGICKDIVIAYDS
jgi:phosphate starvation-inducible PhoH-like protein